MQTMANNGIDAHEAKYLALEEDYLRLKAEKQKSYYIVVYLSEKYGISVRAVYKIISRFKEQVQI